MTNIYLYLKKTILVKPLVSLYKHAGNFTCTCILNMCVCQEIGGGGGTCSETKTKFG
jgi:hypothetical protein